MSQLVAIEQLTPLQIFSNNGLDPLLEQIEKEARSFVLDISTEKGRKEVTSLAYKIAQSKTALDKMGKDLVAGWKEQAKKVDVERARAWDRLEALQKEIRQPLTDWENKEKERVAGHEAAVAELEALGALPVNCPASEIQARLDKLAGDTRDWEEFCVRADSAKKAVLATLTASLDARRKYEAEQAELERLRREEAERKQREHEERLKAEAAAKAKAEAEAMAKVEAEALAAKVEAEKRAAAEREEAIRREKVEAEERARKAEEARLAAIRKAQVDQRAAEEKAKRDAELAAQRERDRIEAEKKAEAEAAAKREADKKHRAKVNRESLTALVEAGVAEDVGRVVIEAIAKKLVPHVTIQY